MTRKLAWIATSIVATATAILTSYIFVIYRPSTDPSQICKYQDTKFTTLILKIRAWADVLIYTLVPSAIILTSNCVIVLTLYRKKRTNDMTVKGDTSVQKSFNKITPMLLLVSTVFVCCTCPVSLFKMSKYEAYSHQAKANEKAKKIKEHLEGMKEKNSKVKQNFRFHVRFRLV